MIQIDTKTSDFPWINNFKIGCCGFPVSRKLYYKHFKLVEIQQSFYNVSDITTASKWRDEAPSDFEFSIKASQLITHPSSSPTYRKAGINIPVTDFNRYGFFRPSSEVYLAWEKTELFARVLKTRAIVFQCPPSFDETTQNIENIIRFFNSIKDRRYLYVWEPRGNWHEQTIKRLCNELSLVHCFDPLERQSSIEPINYFRLHGGPHYRHRYTPEELEILKQKTQNTKSYILFNNIYMYQNALSFASIIQS